MFTTKPYLQTISPITSTGFLNFSRDSNPTASLGSLFKHLAKPFGEEIVPHIQSKPPLVQFEAIYSHPVSSYLGEGSDPLLTTTFFEEVVKSGKVPPEPP